MRRMWTEWPRISSCKLWAELLSLIEVEGLVGRVINVLALYSYGSNFTKINEASLKKHYKPKPYFQVRKPRNLHNEVESDPCPGGPMLQLLRRLIGRSCSCMGTCSLFIMCIQSWIPLHRQTSVSPFLFWIPVVLIVHNFVQLEFSEKEGEGLPAL